MAPRRRSRRPAAGLLLVSPALFWLLLFSAGPLVLVLVYSFARSDGFGGIELAFDLENYRRFFASNLFLAVALRSLGIALMVTPATLLLAYPVAYYLARCPARRRNLLFVLLLVPWWCSILVKNFAWVAILGDHGLVNQALLGLGLAGEPLPLLYNDFSVVVGLVHVLIPFMVLPVFVAIERIDPRLVEAATTMGSGALRAFWEVTLPLSLPGIASGAVLTFILAFGSYVTPALLGSTGNYMIAHAIAEQFLAAFNWPLGAAISIVVLLAMLALMILFNRLVGLDRLFGAVR
jgi:ABC-type spermidine/putrescine transport system permease subunit I